MNLTLTGETRIFPIIGDPIAQVKSPANLSAILVMRGENALVPPMHVSPDNLADAMRFFRHTRNIGGIVVTIPHKIPAIDYCDEISERARFVGSVNIIVKDADNRFIGDNVDGIGYLDGILHQGFDIFEKSALLVGVGGAGSAVAYEILQRGASKLAIHDVDTERRDSTIIKLQQKFPGKVVAGSSNPEGYELVANVTPMGMRAGDPLPVEADKFIATQFVADAITRPEISPMLEIAQAKGCSTMPGAGMFNAEAEILVDYLLGKRINP